MKLHKLALYLTAASLAAPIAAQDTSVAEEDTATEASGEAIVVTGSRIKQDPNNSALPLTVITTEELAREGINNPEQFIAFLSSNGNGADNLASNTDVVTGAQRGFNGASTANLRGQGAGATLVLLNGRRVAAHGLSGQAVDVNQIPFAAIERIEVLKDGASAIYGTDAIGGVINFITKKNFTGLNVTGFTDLTEDKGGNIFRVSGIAGYGDLDNDGFNVMAAISHSRYKPLRGSQRDFVDLFQYDRGLSPETRGSPFATIVGLGTGPNTPGGTLWTSTGTNGVAWTPGTAPFVIGSGQRADSVNVLNLPGGPGCDAVENMGAHDWEAWAIPSFRYACAWDSAKSAYLQQKQDTLTYLARAVFRLGDHEIFAEVTGSDADADKVFSELQLTPNTSTQNYAYRRIAGVNDATYDAVFNRLVAAFPYLEPRRGLPIGYRWRCLECGPREISTATKTNRVALGIDGPVADGWDYRAGFSYASSESKSRLGSGYYYRDALVSALNTGIINPFLFPGQSQSQAARDLIRSTSAEGVVLYGGKYTVKQLDASVSGSLFALPAGDVQIAAGIDYRKENYKFNGDERAANARPVILAAPFDDGNALAGVSRTIKAAYAEILVPLFDGFELTGALRIDDYSGYGSTTNPKISFKYRPVDAVMFRGSYNTGFRIPSFNQLFTGLSSQAYTGSLLVDPVTCPSLIPTGSGPCARITNAQSINRGNPDLGPETAKQFSLGVVLQPTNDISLSVDWWSIKRDGTILLPTLQQLLANYSFFEDRFIRNSAGVITAFDQAWSNAGTSKTEGIEIALRAGMDALGGRINAGIDGSYLLKKKEQPVVTAPFENKRGVFSLAGDLGLKWKHSAFLSYSNEDWTASLSQIFRSGYKNRVLPGVASGAAVRSDIVYDVDDYVIYNMSLSYSGWRYAKFTAGVKNIFNTDPPFAISYDDNTGGGSSWEPRVADPRGRSFTLMAEFKF